MNDKKRVIGFTFAWNGVKEAFLSERNFRIHTLAMIIVVACGFIFKLRAMEWALITFCIGFVLVTELINTAIEKIIDYVKPDIHPQAKIIKDLAAGAVFISALIAAIIGVIIFLPKLYKVFI